MGLDISHCKAVMTPVAREDFFAVSDFPPDQFSKYGFDRYIQPVPALRRLHTVTFLDDEPIRRLAELERESSGYAEGTATYWVGTPESRADDLRALEALHGLRPEQASRMRSQRIAPEPKFYSTTLSYYEDFEEPGIYFAKVGYQRKGVANGFYDHFHGHYLFMRPEDFVALERYLHPECSDEVVQNLRENFLDNFEMGTSFLIVSS